ncbi:phage tail protein [Burkholderia sp. AU31652]|uniref:Tail protein n=2 Tax=Burkholderia cepacia complex TaxID=87882 RepID=A0A6J5J1U5_9BURK|nr:MULTISPECIES: tail protein X [Burkholderia]MBN3750253.1 phage tail protein [Burkholderia sp. Se-20373]MCA8066566.1 tail protein X [Burkholderia sp. AU38729]MCA8258717.1 tail protein X [Burkholderia sp. AU31624]OXI92079.1 phage tail protein [Burkholderia sp. AU31652]OXJ21234.1 phage tail protein [Burkholderia sp. AU6039]
MIVRTLQGDTVDALCWRHYGRTDGTVETVLEANTGLAGLGVVLPAGTPVHLPPLDTATRARPLLQLFD